MSLKEKRTKKKKRKSNFIYILCKITAGPLVWLWMRPKKLFLGEGEKPNLKGMLMCSNHEHLTDPVLFLCAFWNKTLGFLATKDLYNTKAKEFFFSRVHCIPVDKENFSLDSMHEVFDTLKMGRNIVIFPEGKVNTEESGDMLAFKGGIALMAYLSKTMVVPTYIVPVKKWYQRRVLVMGDPMNINQICKAPSMDEMNIAGEKIREKVLELKEKYYLHKGEKR